MTGVAVEQLLATLQFSDSAFPSGLYTMSHGLEGFRQAGPVDAPGVEALLHGMLLHAVGPADATALALAHEAVRAGDWDRVATVDRHLFATKLNAETRRASVRSGHQLSDVARAAVGGPELEAWCTALAERRTPGCQPVATAVVYASCGVGAREAVAADLSAFAVSYLGAALRLRLIDHRQVQVLLHAAAPVIALVTAQALTRDLRDMGGFVPMVDVMSARHERADARLFTS